MKQITSVVLSHAVCTKLWRYTEEGEERRKKYSKPESLSSWQNFECLARQCKCDAGQAV